MTLSKKTKEELIAEVRKLQRKVELLQQKKTPETPVKSAWQSVFRHSVNTVVVIDEDLNVVDINKLAKGITKKEVIGKKAYDFSADEESAKTIKTSIAKAFKTGRSQEYRITAQFGGKPAFLACKAIPMIEKKKVTAVVIEVTDITKDLAIQEQLRENEVKFRMLAHNAADVIYRYSVYPKFICEYVSPSVKQMTGYSPEEYYKNPHLSSSITHPEDRYLFEENNKKMEQGKAKIAKLKPVATRTVRKDGSIIWIESIDKPVYDEKGRLVAIEGISRDITDRKNTEESLRQSEENLSQVLNNIKELVYYVSFVPEKDRRIKYLGQQIETLFGITKKEYEEDSKILIKLCHPEDVPGVEAAIQKVRKTLKPQKFTYRFLHRGKGEYVWLEEHVTPQINKKGQHIGNFGIARDVTEHINAGQKLRDSEERFRMLAENAKDVIYRYTVVPEARYEYISPAILRMSGYTPEDFYRDPYIAFKIIHPEDLHLLGDSEESLKVQNKISDIKDPEVVLRWIRKDGTIVWTATRTQNILDKDGKKIAVEGISRDVTYQRLSEEQLKDSEERFKILSNVTFEGIVFSDNGIIIDANDQFLSLYGYGSTKEITGKDLVNDFIVEEERPLARKFIRTAKPEPLEVRSIKKDGTIITVETKGQYIPYFGKNIKATVIYNITERKKYEQEIKQSRENYKSLVDYSPDGVFIHIDGKVVFANPSALKLAGLKESQTLPDFTLFDFLLPEYHADVTERIRKAFAGEPQAFIEIKIRTLAGEIKTLETKPIVIKFNGQNAILTVVHDITTEKQLAKEQIRAQIAEETNELLEQEITKRKVIQLQLQESQKYTRLIINSSIDMICASDKKGFITEFNEAAQKTFGYTADEVIGKHVSMLYMDPQERIRITNEELYKKGAFAGEVLNKRKNGEKFVAFLSASILKSEDGEIVGAMGVSRDISEMKKAEEKMYAQSAKLNAVFESSSHIIWTVDRKVCVTSYNKNFASFLKKNYNVDAYPGISMISGDTISSNEYNTFWVKKYENAFRGDPQHFETKLVNMHGLVVWREIFLNPIFDESKNVIEVSGIGHDVTEKKFAEEKIRQSLQEKEVLLKEVHHRVKNNLQVISSILNLQSSYVKDPGTLNILKESQNRIKSMAFIHESLYQTKDFSSINFSEYVVNLSQNLIQSYSNFENEIKLNLDIQNVFLNLDLAIPCGLIINEIISNALKYAFVDKKNDCEVTIKMILDQESLVLFIGDNGIGLPKEIDYRNTQSLGLQLVVTLTDQLNGTIEMDSSKGTKYTIIFKQNQVKNRI